MARAVAQLKATLHPRTPPRGAAGMALTQALRDFGDQAPALCQTIEQGIQERTATARGTGRQRLWDLWDGV